MAQAKPKYNTNSIAKVKELDDDQVAEVKNWMETVNGESYPDFFEDIRDGVELCKLLNKIKPGLIAEKKFKKSKIVFVARTNIQIFIEGCKKLGIPETDCIETRYHLHTHTHACKPTHIRNNISYFTETYSINKT